MLYLCSRFIVNTMSSLVQRTLSGAVYVGLVVASILVHPAFFGVLFALFCALAVREFHHLVGSHRFATIMSIILALCLFGIFWCLANIDSMSLTTFAYLQCAYAFVLMLTLVAELFLKAKNPIANWGNVLSSQIMIALPFALMNFVMQQSKWLLLALFITIWVNDTGAYCVGCSTAKLPKGNHKMFPRVSPAKSWEGLFGGFVFALLAGFIYFKVGWFDAMSQPLLTALLFAFSIAVFGTFGDLVESLLKRTIGVKDSGKFMPGHGGVLDRFDSLLLATPAVALLLLLI